MGFDNEDIFCAIPAYNESYIYQTIENALDRASRPDSVFFGIFNQKSNGKKFEDFSSIKNVRSIEASYNEPLGASYARLSATMLHKGEKYFCPMDAHVLFAQDWDSILIENYNLLKQHIDRPALSQSIPGHSKSVYDSDKYKNHVVTSKAYPLTLNDHGETTPDKSRDNEDKFLGKFIEHGLLMGCAEFFTGSEYIYEVSYDPFIMYNPEQEISALRAGSRGYRFFSSGESVMSHLGKVGADSGFDKDSYRDDFFWKYNMDHEYSKDVYRTAYSIAAFASLIGSRFGFYGASSKMSYDEYCSRMPVDYSMTYRRVYDRIKQFLNNDKNSFSYIEKIFLSKMK